MAHFYGSIQGQRGEATRLGSKNSGLRAITAGWTGAISVTLSHKDGKDVATIYRQPHQNSGGNTILIGEFDLASGARL